jgi:phosphate/sulfate permease
VFAVAIVTDVHTSLLAEVMLDTLVTVTLLRTRYAIPTSFTCTLMGAVGCTGAVDNVDVGAVVSIVTDVLVDVRVSPSIVA